MDGHVCHVTGQAAYADVPVTYLQQQPQHAPIGWPPEFNCTFVPGQPQMETLLVVWIAGFCRLAMVNFGNYLYIYRYIVFSQGWGIPKTIGFNTSCWPWFPNVVLKIPVWHSRYMLLLPPCIHAGPSMMTTRNENCVRTPRGHHGTKMPWRKMEAWCAGWWLSAHSPAEDRGCWKAHKHTGCSSCYPRTESKGKRR